MTNNLEKLQRTFWMTDAGKHGVFQTLENLFQSKSNINQAVTHSLSVDSFAEMKHGPDLSMWGGWTSQITQEFNEVVFRTHFTDQSASRQEIQVDAVLGLTLGVCDVMLKKNQGNSNKLSIYFYYQLIADLQQCSECVSW